MHILRATRSLFNYCLGIDICVCSILLDKYAAWLYVIAHQHGEYLVGISSILYRNLLEQTCLRIHRGVPQLLWIHLTKTFVALGMETAVVSITVAVCLDKAYAILLGIAVLLMILVGTLVERRSSDIQMSLLYHLWHKAEEESHDEGIDMRTIDIGIGHDDNLIVAQFVDVRLL